jgi:ABC-type multidrug transport system fused ATPase/permease subunit
LNINNKNNTILNERNNILNIIDSFIEQITKIRRFFIGVSISSIILAPIAISLAIYLFTHQSFFRIVEAEREFGLGLVVLLTAVVIISSILFVTGILQYRQIDSWHKKYESYKKEKDDINQYIANKFKNYIDEEDTNKG